MNIDKILKDMPPEFIIALAAFLFVICVMGILIIAYYSSSLPTPANTIVGNFIK